MNIKIDDSLTLLSVQQEFNRIFPYLRINFFQTFKDKSGIVQRKLLEKCIRTFGEFRLNNSDDVIDIIPEMSVSDLEKKFLNEYGLKTQVYRSSGRIWLETNATDSWTLEEQNSQGEALSA